MSCNMSFAMAAADTQTSALNGFGSYDKNALKNYAAMSAMYWPGFDSAGYAAAQAAQVQASALAAAATSLNQTVLPQTVTSSSAAPTSLMPSIESEMKMIPQTTTFPAHSTTPCTPTKKKAMPVPTHLKDETYWERRKRNNESARRSRESRRQKEEGMAFRVVYLEQENLRLHTELSMLRAEIEKLRMLVYSPAHH